MFELGSRHGTAKGMRVQRRSFLERRTDLEAQRLSSLSQVVFRDSAFADDVAKTNITAILEQRGLENVRSL